MTYLKCAQYININFEIWTESKINILNNCNSFNLEAMLHIQLYSLAVEIGIYTEYIAIAIYTLNLYLNKLKDLI